MEPDLVVLQQITIFVVKVVLKFVLKHISSSKSFTKGCYKYFLALKLVQKVIVNIS